MRSSTILLQASILIASFGFGKSASTAQGRDLLIRQNPNCTTCSVFTQAATTCAGDKQCMCASNVQTGLQTCLDCLDNQQVAALDASSFNKLCAGIATVTAAGPVPTALTSVSLGGGVVDGGSATISASDDGSSGSSSTDGSASATADSSAASEPSAAATSTPPIGQGAGATNTAAGGQPANTGTAGDSSSSSPQNGSKSAGVMTIQKGGVTALGAVVLFVPLLL